MLEVGRWMTKIYFKTLQIFSGAFFYPQTPQTLQPNKELFPAIRYYSSCHRSPSANPPILQPNCGVFATIGAMGFLFR